MNNEPPSPPTPPRRWFGVLLPVSAAGLSASSRRRRRGRLLVLAVLLVIAGLIAWNQMHHSRPHKSPPRAPQPYTPQSPAFSGDSTLLHDTVIVPTLDTPMPRDANVIWCSSFEPAWNRLHEDVVKGPVRTADHPEHTGQPPDPSGGC